jgi:hypothetical protein
LEEKGEKDILKERQERRRQKRIAYKEQKNPVYQGKY